MKPLEPGVELDGFVVDECLHVGGMAFIYRVHPQAAESDPGFDLVMKVPRMMAGDGAENLVSFEIEHQLLPVLTGSHVPRFVAAGDVSTTPYLVMEYVPGQTLDHWLHTDQQVDVPMLAQLGAATAHALHSLHKQNAVHLDLKPANVVIRPDGRAVLLDFGLSWHVHYPDLLAEQLRKAVGTPVWISPEQVVGVRGDPRSDIFALGVILYELATGRTPFGNPQTEGGLRQRLWADPRPPRSLRPDLPEWFQEIVLRCLEPVAANRYPSAAHLAFDLSHPEQVKVTGRGRKLQATGFWTHFRRWVRAAGMHYQPSPLPSRQAEEVPIVMVAVPHKDVSEDTLYALQQAVSRSLGIRPGARLACVTVISPSAGSGDADDSEVQVHRRYLSLLHQWAQPLNLANHQASFHVLEATDVAQALIRYAEGNHVSIIVMGAATHGVQLQRWVATVPIKVAMDAPCTVMLVRQVLSPTALAERQATSV